MDTTKSFWKDSVFRFIEIIILPVSGMLVAFAYHEVENKTVAVSIVVGYVIIVALFVGVDLYRRYRQMEIEGEARRIAGEAEQKSREAEQKSRETEAQSKLLILAREGEMLSSASQKVWEVLWQITLQYSKLTGKPFSWDPSETGWGYKRKRDVLKHICEVLKEDRKQYGGPSDYFKATLFTVSSSNLLKLDCCYYPPGISPTTEKIERNLHHTVATAFHCLDEQTVQAIPNVPEEGKKGANARWVELYPGQAQNYGSMVCVPITTGERATHTFEVISILTIDTNRLDYFSDQKKEENFLAILLAPFRQQLSFIYLVTSDASLSAPTTGRDQNGTESA